MSIQYNTIDTMNSTIQVRVAVDTKRKADKAFKKMGLDLSSGIKLYLHQVIHSGSIPFIIRTENGFTPEQEKKMVKETKEALLRGKSFANAKELFDDVVRAR